MQIELFSSIFTTSSTSITMNQMLYTMATSLVLGFILAMVYKYRTQYSKEFVSTITLLPTLIAIIILLVNGNLGTSVAVAGAFSLIRFRSAQGSSKELLAVFLATAIGLATGMGYLILAIAFTLFLSVVILILEQVGFTQPNRTSRYLTMTVGQDFDVEYFLKEECQDVCQRTELLSLQYKKDTETLTMDFIAEMTQQVSDKALMDKLLAVGPLDLHIHQKIPQSKRL